MSRIRNAVKALAGTVDERDLTLLAGLALVGGALAFTSVQLALLVVGSVLLFIALRR